MLRRLASLRPVDDGNLTADALSREQATQIMLKVHREGRGVCGVYPKDVAASKVNLVTEFTKQHQHPLQCCMEEI